MQSNLEVWEEQLKELYEKKKENGKGVDYSCLINNFMAQFRQHIKSRTC